MPRRLAALLCALWVPSVSQAQDHPEDDAQERATGHGAEASEARDREAEEDRENAEASGARGDEAEQDGETSDDDTGWTGFPLVAYAPETGVVFAGYLMRSFRMPDSGPDTRASSARMVAGYTTRGQLGIELVPELYLDDESVYVSADLTFRDYPSDFFGIGNDTTAEDEEQYDLRLLGLSSEISGRVAPHTYVGLVQDAEHTWVDDVEPGGLLATQEITGASGGWYVGFGLVARYDDRDSTFDARHGGFHELRLLRYDHLFGSDFEATQLDLDLRRFFVITGEHGLALRGLAQLVSGDPPFTAMPELGGANLLRGLYGGRYRDENLLAAQVEYRFPIYWRFGGVLFAGAGEVAESVGDFYPGGVHLAGGGGLRFSIDGDERVNARADVGASGSAVAVYVSVGEAF